MSTSESDRLERVRRRVTERVMVYVDGMNLYYGILATGIPRYLWVDIQALSQSLLRPDQILVGVKYYMSRFVSDGQVAGLVNSQRDHFKALESLAGLSIVEGKFQSKMGKCRSCGHEWQSYEEKMTDVNIAVEMVCDAEDDLYDVAIVISGDGDLTGPIETVRSRHPGKFVLVALPPNRRSASLLRVASAHIDIGRSRLRNSQLPERLRAVDGYPLRRPVEWR